MRSARFSGACPLLPESDSQSPKCVPSLRATTGSGRLAASILRTAIDVIGPGRLRGRASPSCSYFPVAARAAWIFAFTASRLKLAPFCIGGNSIAVMASFSTSC